MMDLKAIALEALKPYYDEIGLVQNWPGTHSGNPLLYTAEVCIVLKRNGWLSPELREQFLRGIKACQIEPGYYRKHPNFWRDDQERQDDYLALASLSVTLGAPWIAQEILDYGRRNWKKVWWILKVPYYFPNEFGWAVPFNIRAWIGSYPSCIACLKIAAGEKISWLHRTWLEVSIKIGPDRRNPSDRDSFILPWVMLSVYKDPGLAAYHNATVTQFYPGGYFLLFACYFGIEGRPNFDHWLASYAVEAA